VKVPIAFVWLWFHTTLGRQLSMIQRNRRTSHDHLEHQVKVWRAFSSNIETA